MSSHLEMDREDGGPIYDAEAFASWIVEEDDDFVAVNKPGDLVCHPSKKGPGSSLVGLCRTYLQVESIHLVHRLDRETSGLVLFAKHKRSARLSQMAMQDRNARKLYLGIHYGSLNGPVVVNRHLAKDLDSSIYVKQTVRSSNSSQSAKTEYVPLLCDGGYTLTRIIPHSGRKHQIRAHAAWLGHPLVGDKIYGPDETCYLEFIESGWSARMERILHLRRQALHAMRLEFDTPQLKRVFTAPLAEDLKDFCLEHMPACREKERAMEIFESPSE